MALCYVPTNIIVKMPNWLGDLVMATSLLQDLRAFYPNASITAMCSSHIAPLLENNPNITQLYSYVRPNGWIHRRQHLEIIESIRQEEYDLAILLTNSFSSAWWFWRAGVKRRLGYKGHARSLLLTDAISFPTERSTQHLVKTYKQLLAPLGIALSKTKPQLYLAKEELEAAREKLTHIIPIELHAGIIIGINPGAAYGSAKCWPKEYFIGLSKKLLQHPKVCLLYFGDQAGAPLVDDICSHIPSDRVINLAGKTSLRELLADIKQCTAFLSNDSGPMHIAAALQTPLVALFGSTNDTVTGPYEWGNVIHKHVACSPCYKRTCPIDFRCMRQISEAEVYAALQKMIPELRP